MFTRQERRLSLRIGSTGLAIGLLLLIALPLDAQGRRRRGEPAAPADGSWRIDPYTAGVPEAMKRAGVARYDPFRIGPSHDTFDVERELGGVEIRWMETAHFKIGSSLPGYVVPKDRVQRKKLRGELLRLRKNLPRAPADPKHLDPWLRMHLIAMRVEDVYSDFQERLGVTDADFPRGPESAYLGENFMGIGPYLGQLEKYVILITARESSIGRYTNKFLGSIYRYPKRFNLGQTSSLGFCTATEFDGWLDDDTALHCHIVYNVVHNLCDGYRLYTQDIPVWFKGGLSQWYLRRIDPRYNNYDRPPDGKPDGRIAWDWEPSIAALVKFDNLRPIEDMLAWRDYAEHKFVDYIFSWSRVDYLMSLGDARFSAFMHRMKTPLTDGRSIPSHEATLELQKQAMQEAWGLDAKTLDASWRDYVGKTYPKK